MSSLELGSTSRSRRPRPKARLRHPASPLLLAFSLVAAGALLTLALQPRAVASPQDEPAPSPAAPAGAELTGHPRVLAGDLIEIGGEPIRLAGVDAPDAADPRGEAARRHLERLIDEADGAVLCADTGERTRGRMIGLCFTPDGRDLGAAMVEAGWARDWPASSLGQHAALERAARDAGRGLHARR